MTLAAQIAPVRETRFGGIVLAGIEAVARRAPIATIVRSSLGTMRERTAVFVRVTDAEGRHGYGEVWCNFPHVGAEHRQRLVNELVGPLLIELGVPEDGAVYDLLIRRLHRLAIQSGEWGPLRQVAAGLDAAMADLAARRAGLPLYRFLQPDASGSINAYASGIGPETPGSVALAAAEAGHTAFKLKVGFGRETDLAALRDIRAAAGRDARLMIDSNQAWSLSEAVERANEYADFDLTWLEEPIAVDRPAQEWREIAAQSPVALAGGENIGSLADFETFISGRVLGFVQPDVAKFGGVSGCLAVARKVIAAGQVYCPHFLGGGIGLVTSAHLLAAAGGSGFLEIDTNPNPLRQTLTDDIFNIVEGRLSLPHTPGIGIAPDHLFR